MVDKSSAGDRVASLILQCNPETTSNLKNGCDHIWIEAMLAALLSQESNSIAASLSVLSSLIHRFSRQTRVSFIQRFLSELIATDLLRDHNLLSAATQCLSFLLRSRGDGDSIQDVSRESVLYVIEGALLTHEERIAVPAFTLVANSKMLTRASLERGLTLLDFMRHIIVNAGTSSMRNEFLDGVG